jgi:hypothetical protein
MPTGGRLETDWRPVVESYNTENAKVRILIPGQRLGLDYDVVPAAVIRSSGNYIQVSAVGFNESKTRALVYVAHYCGSLCGGGRHHILEKADGAWREARLQGITQCVWDA